MSDTPTRADLLPCPLCGDSMEINGGLFHHINPGTCMIGVHAWEASVRNVTAWNTRAPTADAALIEAHENEIEWLRERAAELYTQLTNATQRIAALEGEVENVEQRGFMRGYLIAVSTMLHQHGCTVTAEDAIRDSGISLVEAEALDLADFDMKALRLIFSQIKRRDANKRCRNRARAQIEGGTDAPE